MASNEVQLGGGNATGMFYTAPAGTALPTYPGEELAAAWTEVGDVDADGITFTPRDSDTLKNWAGQPKRVIPGADPATIQAKVMDTTEDSLKTVFGEDNVIVTPATTDHGKLISIDMDSKPAPAAFLFVMKDGDDMKILGTSNGLVSELADVAFKNDEAIEWDVTIQGTWKLICDDGQTV
jgi:hypothetical protein